MKIEKINENQIRCILNKEDLQSRNLQLTELAYGSKRAQDFFQDIVLEANKECGFEAEDMPLMIEAIPMAGESLILLVTKVDSPDELDPRFSEFTPNNDKFEPEVEEKKETPFGESVLDVFTQLGNSILSKILGKNNLPPLPGKTVDVELPGIDMNVTVTKETKTSEKDSKKSTNRRKSDAAPNEDAEITVAKEKAFRFTGLEQVAAFAKSVQHSFHGDAVLYKNPADHSFYLVLLAYGADVNEYNIACNVACEYGTMLTRSNSGLYEEHYKKILSDNTIATLAQI